MVDGWFGGLGDEKVLVDFSDVRVIDGGTMALADAIISFAAIASNGEKLRSMENRLSWVAAQGPEGWQVVHQHISSPIDEAKMEIIWSRS